MVNFTNQILVKNYDFKEYNFYEFFLDLLKVYTKDLNILHENLPKSLIPNEVVSVGNDQNLSVYKILYQIDEGYDLNLKKKNSGFLNVFDKFVSYISKNIFKEELIYQSRPTLRVNFPVIKRLGTGTVTENTTIL